MSDRELFCAEDFDPGGPPADDGQELCTYYWAAKRANAKFVKWAEGLPVAQGKPDGGDYKEIWIASEVADATHTARLAFIQPIEKAACAHSVAAEKMGDEPWKLSTNLLVCGACGIKLKPPNTWEAAE